MRPATRRSAERHQQVEVVCGASGPGREREGPLAEVAAGAAVAPEDDPVRFVAAGAHVGLDADVAPVDGDRAAAERKSGVSGKSVSVSVDLGGLRLIKKKTKHK